MKSTLQVVGIPIREESFTEYCLGLTAYNRYDVCFTLDGISLILTI